MRRYLAILLALSIAGALRPQDPVFHSDVKLVVINVSVTGRDGKPVETLAQDDFQLYEDGKPQELKSVEFQRLGADVLPPLETPQERKRVSGSAPPPDEDLRSRFQDRRLIVMLFDFTSMQPAEQLRALEAARKFIGTQLTASDVVSIMTFSTVLHTVQDFSSDRDLLLSTIQGFRIGEGSELAVMADTGADPEDQSGQFVADDTEFNIFNTDRKLAALEQAARKLAPYPEKKALVYFSSGVEKTGVDNQSQLRATINAAVRSNVSFYPIDARGLTAAAPGGDASQAGAVGSGLYSGRGQKALRDSFHNQQETLYSLAADTGGKALLDSNDVTAGLREVQKNINSYYILTYVSANGAEDGRYRRIQVKLAPSQAQLRARLDYRQGYFAPSTFKTMSGSGRESQMQQALETENAITDIPLAIEVDYFRLAKSKYFVPVSVRIPGSALAFRNKGSKAATELDFIGQFKDSRGRVASVVRDTIPLKVAQATAGEVSRKQIQYDTGFTLTPGKYTLRFVVRENGEGKVGTFETPVTIPDLATGSGLRLSSVILSNQREPVSAQIAGARNSKKATAENPLVDAKGEKVVPNVMRTFRPGQNLLVYLEVYDPGARASVSASVGLYRDDAEVLESAPVKATMPGPRGENVVPLQLQIPLKNLKSGSYLCQVNVIDELGRKFAFPRTSIIVLDR